jgi:hypothetical protein
MNYVYINSEPQLWTVGFYLPNETWEAESDHSSTESAAARVSYLNGGQRGPGPDMADTVATLQFERELFLSALKRAEYYITGQEYLDGLNAIRAALERVQA